MLQFTGFSLGLKGTVFEINIPFLLLSALCVCYILIEKTSGVNLDLLF